MIRAFEMFSGLGGSSRGAAAAGAVISGGIDAWPLATEVFADNFPGARVITSPVEEQDPSRILDETESIDLLLASPECTNHSCARGSRPRSNESRDTAFEVVRYARAMEPRWIVIENVIHMRPWSRYQEFLGSLRSAGYHLAEHVVDAADHGVRQRRKRLFVLCDRDAEPPSSVPKQPGPKPVAAGILDRPGIWKRSPLDNGRRAAATLARTVRAVSALGSDQPFLIVYYGNDGAGGWQPLTVPLRTVTTLDRFGLCEPSDDGLMLRMLQVPELARAMWIRRQPDPRPRFSSRADHAAGKRRVPAGDEGRSRRAGRKEEPEVERGIFQHRLTRGAIPERRSRRPCATAAGGMRSAGRPTESQLHDPRPRHVATGMRNQVHEQLLAEPVDWIPPFGRNRRCAYCVSGVDSQDKRTGARIKQQGR